MKLILREYLASLRERKELDALLPDLLSQMGLDVFSRPGIGGRQYGVDIAAFGSIDGAEESVYLLSVKSGDLNRADWDGPSNQSLRQSLNEIIDVYIPSHLPPLYRNKPVVICLCFGGEVKESIRLNVTSFEKRHETSMISFSEWNGDVIAGLVEENFLREELLPLNCRPLLRKSLALLDEPESSYKYFSRLVKELARSEATTPEQTITLLRQMNLCLWILYAWCREQNNIETAYYSSELVTLLAWELCKPSFDGQSKAQLTTISTLHAIEALHFQITDDLLEKSVFPYVHKLHALSSATSPSCAVDVNLKLFDMLGRIALSGLWAASALEQISDSYLMQTQRDLLAEKIKKHHKALIQLIKNNPILYTPYKDDHAIDIALAITFLALTQESASNMHVWLHAIMSFSLQQLKLGRSYPCNLTAYHELIEHPQQGNETYFKEVTAGSILYPLIAAVASVYKFSDVYELVQQVKSEFLEHCNFQFWFPNDTSEDNFYLNQEPHGATLSHVNITDSIDTYLDPIFRECGATSSYFNNLSGVIFQEFPFPIIFMACRHYRLPIPMHIFQTICSLYKDTAIKPPTESEPLQPN